MSDIIHMEHVCKTFGELSLLEDLTLEVPSGRTVAVIGPGGSGKSTMPHLLMGLEQPDSGRIEIDGDVMWQKKSNGCGVDVNHLRLVRAKLGMVFQQFNLFPHMTAQANAMVAPIHVLGMARAAADQRAMEYLEIVELSDKAQVSPGHLSGGQKTRRHSTGARDETEDHAVRRDYVGPRSRAGRWSARHFAQAVGPTHDDDADRDAPNEIRRTLRRLRALFRSRASGRGW